MSDSLFGTSGVRGIVGEDITPELAIGLARSFLTEIGGTGEVVVGRDTRVSGEMLEDALVSGFLSGGFNVDLVGVVPTPVVSYSVTEVGSVGGVMITASHNPPEYNGIKFFGSEGMALPPKRENKIESHYYSRDFSGVSWSEIGQTKKIETLENYLNHLTDKISLEKKYKIVIDSANGPTSKTTPELFQKLGCEVVTVNSQLDGSFPGRLPEPSEGNLGDLVEVVRVSGADLGVAHDGDGDRLAVVDDEGRFVNQDKLLALVGSYSVDRFGGGVVTTVDASKIIEEQVSEVGGEVSRTEVGDVSVAQGMDSKNFVFGGEPSGTWIMGDVHMCPDGTLGAARVLEMLDTREEKLSELIDSISSYPIIREKVDCPNEKKPNKMETVQEKAPSEFKDVKEVITVDGVRLEFENGDWVLIRPSGTEPYIRITAEANQKKRAESIVETAENLLKK